MLMLKLPAFVQMLLCLLLGTQAFCIRNASALVLPLCHV
jgi:hypothetical protein